MPKKKKVEKKPPAHKKKAAEDDGETGAADKKDSGPPMVVTGVLVQLRCPCYNVLSKVGAKEAWDKKYGKLSTQNEKEFDLAVKIGIDDLKDQKAKDALVTSVSQMKATIIGSVFDYHFTNMMAGKADPPFKFDLRADTTIYFFPKINDRVTVIFTIDFKEKVDKAIAKVFMTEFTEARRNLQAAPPVAFNINPPAELAHYKITQPVPGLLGFASFVVLKSHLDKPEKKDRIVHVLSGFRNYLQYHIKCSKAHFHARMRARVLSLLQVLNRAKAEVSEKAVVARTISGKTFVRKV